MKSGGKIHILDGKSLWPEKIREAFIDPEMNFAVSRESLHSVGKAYDFLRQESKIKIVYGVNTGLGPMASHLIGIRQAEELQLNLVRSHSTGVGDPIVNEYVFAAMLIRLNTLIKGFSGVSPELVRRLALFINHRIFPVVPEHGAVGTSGDLVQLAHIALALIGEGEVFFRGRRMQTGEALRILKLKPYRLRPKEGLALINGTSMMTGIACAVLERAKKLLNLTTLLSAYALELVSGFSDALAEELHEKRPHPGQVRVAEAMRRILSSSRLLRDRTLFQKSTRPEKFRVSKISQRVQDVYSFRCVPQIFGPVVDAFLTTRSITVVEMNSVTDNPVVDWNKKLILHGGNFHGDYVAVAMDNLKLGLAKLGLLLERRINFFLNQNSNRAFPPFLNMATPGLTLGLQGLQFVATSTAAQNQTFAYPHSVHSISTNADNQDVVSMGSDAAMMTARVLDNAQILATLELITLMQATDIMMKENKLSLPIRSLYFESRKFFPKVYKDRALSTEVEALKKFLEEGLNLENWLGL